MEYNELMKALGDNLGLDGFEPDGNGQYKLSIDGTIVSFIELPQSGLMDTVAKVCELPSEGGEQIFKILLTAMAPGGAAEAYAFFIAPDDECVYLRRTDVLASLDVDGYRQTLEDFCNTLDEWRSSIKDFQQVLPEIDEALDEQADEARQLNMNAEGFLKV